MMGRPPYWNWKELNQELVDLYKVDVQAVKKFSIKYRIPIRTVHKQLVKLGINKRKHADIKGKIHPLYKHGKWMAGNGYVTINIDGKYVLEHRYVMEKALGRKLKKEEIVHHIDETFEGRSNNDISNLQLMTKADHQKQHAVKQKYYITWSKDHEKWRLRVWGKTRLISFGLYETKEEALARAEEINWQGNP